jgi:azurin
MKAVLTLAAAVALAAQALPAQAADACFRTRDIQNHRKVDSNTIYVRVLNKDIYRITSSSACFAGTTSSDALVIKVIGASDLICKPIDLDLAVHTGPVGTSHCIVSSITRLTPQEAAAIPKKLRP